MRNQQVKNNIPLIKKKNCFFSLLSIFVFRKKDQNNYIDRQNRSVQQGSYTHSLSCCVDKVPLDKVEKLEYHNTEHC